MPRHETWQDVLISFLYQGIVRGDVTPLSRQVNFAGIPYKSWSPTVFPSLFSQHVDSDEEQPYSFPFQNMHAEFALSVSVSSLHMWNDITETTQATN